MRACTRHFTSQIKPKSQVFWTGNKWLQKGTFLLIINLIFLLCSKNHAKKSNQICKRTPISDTDLIKKIVNSLRYKIKHSTSSVQLTTHAKSCALTLNLTKRIFALLHPDALRCTKSKKLATPAHLPYFVQDAKYRKRTKMANLSDLVHQSAPKCNSAKRLFIR